jgi:hypothetical protein
MKKIYLYIMAACMLLASCRTQKVATEVRTTDTVTIVKDSIIIRNREVKVNVPVPIVQLRDVVPEDTTSILMSDIYKSKAWLKNGKLYHTLETLPNATITGSTTLSDTTKTSTKEKAINNNSQKIIKVNELTSLQKFFYKSGIILWFLFIVLLIVYLTRKNK